MDAETKTGPGAWNIGWGWLVTIPLVGIVTWAASRGLNNTFCQDELSKNALDILKERYVLGEIDKDEFDQKYHDIMNKK